MSRFEAPLRNAGSTHVQNLAGGDAFNRSPKAALASIILTSTLQDTFYESAQAQLLNTQQLCRLLAKAGKLEFLAKAALYSRHEGGLRTISHVLAGEVAGLRHLYPDQRGLWGPSFFQRIVFRLDDMAEIAAYFLGAYPSDRPRKAPFTGKSGMRKTLPNAMRRGFRKVFEKASPHELAKWNGASTRSLTLRQLAHLVHPTGGASSAVYRLRGGVLESADTHEVAMTKAAGDEEVVASEWARLFAEGKIRYMAAMRGARRIIEQAPECVPALVAKLTSQVDIEGSKVLPFQIVVARDQVAEHSIGREGRAVVDALDEAIELSMANCPKLEGDTLVVVDNSGSMKGRPVFLACLFATALVKAADFAEFMVFSDDALYCAIDRKASFSTNRRMVESIRMGGSTNFHSIFERARQPYDRIVILSDMQGWVQGGQPAAPLAAYEQRSQKSPWIYTWDVTATKSAMFPEKRIVPLAGINARVFDVMKAAEADPMAMVAAIEKIEL